jgi:hypothetical protein
MKIEGVPEGWELIRIGRPEKGEHFLDGNNMPDQAEHDHLVMARPIIRKVERPKQYRPFANAEEFKPHRDRWVRLKHTNIEKELGYRRFNYVYENGTNGEEWAVMFKKYVFEDGTPFGVEVSE